MKFPHCVAQCGKTRNSLSLNFFRQINLFFHFQNAGFTKEERDGFDDLLKENFVDTFRHFYPNEEKKYTFWTYMMNARAKNVGWRLDYFVTSKKIVDKICDNVIRDQCFGSDHCPSTLFIAV